MASIFWFIWCLGLRRTILLGWFLPLGGWISSGQGLLRTEHDAGSDPCPDLAKALRQGAFLGPY